jgi:uncharacterized protein (DUF736 family)
MDGMDKLFPDEESIGEEESAKKGERPDFRVVQPYDDKNGNVVYKQVGALWKKRSKSGNDFYTLSIGSLRLLVFPNVK